MGPPGQRRQLDAAGKTIRIVHDLGTRTETVVDRNGNATSYRYDDRGNVIEKVDALGNRWAYAFDQKGNMLVEIDPLGNAVRKTYDSNNNGRQREQDERPRA